MLSMFTLIGAMAELELSLISERVTAGMKAAKARGKHLGRLRMPSAVVARIEELAKMIDLSVRAIHRRIGAKIGRGVIGDIVSR
jgi:DNA invertase Pin-like site-specific DNA recombinase